MAHPSTELRAGASPAAKVGLRELLRFGPLRRLAGVRMLASLGDGAFQGALFGAVLFDPSQRSNAGAIAAGFAVLLLPYSLIGPFAGALLDRWSRRQVLVWANVARAAVVGVLTVLLALGAPLWVMFVVALLVTGSGRFVGSGLSAALPHVAAKDSLVLANSLTTTAGAISTLLGGSYTLFLRVLFGRGHTATLIGTVSVLLFYLGASALVRAFARPALGPDATDEPPQPLKAVLQGFSAGVRHAVARRTVGANILMIMVVRLAVGMSTLAVVLLFQHYFLRNHGLLRGGLPGVAEVLAVSGVGLFVGALTTAPVVLRVGRCRYVTVLLIAVGLLVGLGGSRFSQSLTLLSAFLLAFVYQSTKICADTVVQSDSDDAYIGRVFALYDTSTNITYVSGFALAVPLVPSSGRSPLLVLLVMVVLVLTGVCYGWAMRNRERRCPDPIADSH